MRAHQSLSTASSEIKGWRGAPGYDHSMTWRTKRMMRRSKPRVYESKLLAGTISILWSGVGLAALLMLAIGLFLYLPGTNGIENPVVTVP